MIRQDIILANYKSNSKPDAYYTYIVDLYKHGVDTSANIIGNYVMLRKYNVINDMLYDTDVYLVEKSLISHIEDIVWPITNNDYVSFSVSPQAFNINYNDKVLCNGGDEVYDIVEFDENNDHHIADIPCDVLRIYHPHNKTDELRAIIYVDTTIGNTHFHVMCKKLSDGVINSEEDFSIGMNHYSEYVEYYMPNLEWIMSGGVYYEERLSLVKAGLIGGEDDASTFLRTPDNGLAKDGAFLSFEAYKVPFIIVTEKDEDGNDLFYKKFIVSMNDTVAQDYVEFPLRISIYPYTGIDNSSSFYNDSSLGMNSDIMHGEAFMSLAGSIGFDQNHIPSFIACFQFPGKDRFMTFRDAYEHFYHVDLNDYTGIVEYDDEDDDEYVEQKQCGFCLEVFTDYHMTQRLTYETFEIDNPQTQLNDFSFRLDSVFDNWDQLPDMLVMRAKFIDKWLGNVIMSNPVLITEDQYKYLINSFGTPSVAWSGQEAEHTTIYDMDLTKINFIDKISCNIIKKADDNNITGMTGNSPKILYKPVFYRVQDLQNIKIRMGLVQNIGVALGDYMTKVESFKMILGGREIVESARNDIYVIFSVDSSIVAGTNSGPYHIANQDGEYISSGTYETIV